MNNETVAWMQTWQNQDGELKQTVNIEQIGKQDIPLYTHPVELTDEEILEELLIPKSEWNSYKAHHCLKQIRAILRKAQKK